MVFFATVLSIDIRRMDVSFHRNGLLEYYFEGSGIKSWTEGSWKGKYLFAHVCVNVELLTILVVVVVVVVYSWVTCQDSAACPRAHQVSQLPYRTFYATCAVFSGEQKCNGQSSWEGLAAVESTFWRHFRWSASVTAVPAVELYAASFPYDTACKDTRKVTPEHTPLSLVCSLLIRSDFPTRGARPAVPAACGAHSPQLPDLVQDPAAAADRFPHGAVSCHASQAAQAAEFRVHVGPDQNRAEGAHGSCEDSLFMRVIHKLSLPTPHGCAVELLCINFKRNHQRYSLARFGRVKARLHMRFLMRLRCDFAHKTCLSLPRTGF